MSSIQEEGGLRAGGQGYSEAGPWRPKLQGLMAIVTQHFGVPGAKYYPPLFTNQHTDSQRIPAWHLYLTHPNPGALEMFAITHLGQNLLGYLLFKLHILRPHPGPLNQTP